MNENPFTKKRRENIQTLKELIRDKQPIKHKKLVGLMGIYGIREETINSYLDVLSKAGFIVYDAKAEAWKMQKDV